MDENQEIIEALGFNIACLGFFCLVGIIKPGSNFLFGITVCACFFTFTDFLGKEKKRTRVILYLLAIFALIVAPQLPFDKTFDNLDQFTNFFTLTALGVMIMFSPQKKKLDRQKDKKIKELEDTIKKMKN
ncbi:MULTISPECIES: hypothetical protein [Bacillus]|uniref:Uncharacterized protein n=1 Tax=Bacillus haynesii TaxID=1925021 RepID=A0AA90ER98_9BACI|nr:MULTISPECIES: hypothetical protein [Bacillus]MCY7791638.1 hypothetical protein [Bacillus haynesii]MCY7800786.1 hypothetical protein [Bacillus haynesii]MCY8023520.1 hypothetical protein [Bacillus licheniformis]MCY9225774.1 hypothetical protein [Bacillus haynesii]MCY9279244.1 hypothetical protein [Bacillus haynesii]